MIVEETGENPECPICKANDECVHVVANIDRTFRECHGGELYEREIDFRSEIKDTFVDKIKAGADPVWKLEGINELWLESADSYDRENEDVMLDGDVFYIVLVEMLINAGAIDHPGQLIVPGGPGMTSSITLLYARNPKKVVDSALKAIRRSLRELS